MSEMVKALGLALDSAARARDGKPPPMATCPRDDTPLISTLAFTYKEFVCLECGGQFGFVEPKPAEETPELSARYEALQAEWDEHVAPLLREGKRDEAISWLEAKSSRGEA